MSEDKTCGNCGHNINGYCYDEPGQSDDFHVPIDVRDDDTCRARWSRWTSDLRERKYKPEIPENVQYLHWIYPRKRKGEEQMSGKGDTYRPVNKEKYDANYIRIFGEKCPECLGYGGVRIYFVYDSEIEPCQACNGSGRIYDIELLKTLRRLRRE